MTSAGETAPSYLTLKAGSSNQQLTSEAETGTSVFGANIKSTASEYGTTTYFPFIITGRQTAGAKSFIISWPGRKTSTFPIQDDVFVVPSATEISGTVINATVAARSGINGEAYSIQIAAPTAQMGTLGPKVIRATLNMRRLPGMNDGYALWQGSVDLGKVPTGLVSVSITREGATIDMFMVNPGAAGW